MDPSTFMGTFLIWTTVAGGLLSLVVRRWRLRFTILKNLRLKLVPINRNHHDDDDDKHDHSRAA
jgi:hypothetical protein